MSKINISGNLRLEIDEVKPYVARAMKIPESKVTDDMAVLFALSSLKNQSVLQDAKIAKHLAVHGHGV